MNILRKVQNVKLGEEEYIMTFDMKSIAIFKEMTGKSFLQSSARLGLLEDDLILSFIASTLRKTEDSAPVGKQVYNMDIIYLLLNLSQNVVELVTSALPQSTKPDKNISKKK